MTAKHSLKALALAAAFALPVVGAHAQQVASSLAAVPARSGFDAYTSAHALSNGYGDWREAGVRGFTEVGPHLLQGELATMRRFDESGNYLGVADTYTFNQDWFASLSAGAGDGAFYLPRYRVDAFVNRKFLPGRNLIGTLGAAYYRAPDGHVDRSASIGGTYYFDVPLVVQGEVRFNNSNPGNIKTQQQFVAATLGRDKQTQLIGRYAWGREGYQAIGAGTSLVDFPSKEGSLKVRHWLGETWGVQAGIEAYRNPYYTRKGGTVGFFWLM